MLICFFYCILKSIIVQVKTFKIEVARKNLFQETAVAMRIMSLVC